jgi:hypothetical protein
VWQPCPNTYPSRLHTGDRAYSADEEREVIRRLKAFGYL